MPPRLLPKEFGFIDTVRRDDAESVWMSGKFVNHLAAMPSMHFGYSFMIGVTLVYHSGALSSLGCAYGGWKGKGKVLQLGKWWKVWYCVLGVAYPTMILTTIIATANHVCRHFNHLFSFFFLANKKANGWEQKKHSIG
jgi:hypothetical protein